MADSYRPKASVSSSTKAAYGVKAKSSRLAAPKNQQPPGATTPTPVLPRIDRLPQKPQPTSAKNGGQSILLLAPRRTSSDDTISSEETSPTYHGDELDGPSAKAAWCTPRNPVPEPPTGSHITSFFAAPEGGGGYDDSSIAVPTPLRLQSVELSINANEEQYRVDLEQLASNSDKFFEISMSANQHLEHMHSQLPNVSDAFDQTASALQDLSSDIAALRHQHESAKSDMTNRFEAAMGNNAEEMVSLSEAHAHEKNELLEAHERELQQVDAAFQDKITELEAKYTEMEKQRLEEIQELRQTSESQMQALRESNRAEKELRERSAKAALETLQTKAQVELDDLRSSTEAAYTELQQRSQTQFAELRRTSTDEFAAMQNSMTAEILALKQNAAASLAALAERSERELQEHREQSNEALHRLKYYYAMEREHLLETTAEEVARLRMFEIEQSTRMEDRRCQETKALRDELETSKTENSTQTEELHRRFTSELEVLKATSKAEKKLLLQTHAAETESIRSAAAQELSQTITSYEERLHSMTAAHAAEVAQNNEEAAQAREALITKYEADLTTMQNERAREKDALILHYETELEALKQANREEHDKTVKLHETQVAQLREVHSSRVLSLEMVMRERKSQAEDTIREKDAELDSRQERVAMLEASEIALKAHHEQYAERSLELVEQQTMSLSELESEIWRLGQLNLEKGALLDSTNQALKIAEEDLQVKASTILELTFVIKSRDDEIEKLRNALLATVQTVNTKTEILELTTETLSSKAKELEAAKSALRLESGKLSMVEESMNQKVGMLENSELKLESMRLNMENMRLEMKRMQMDMKLQLEHTEGEMELKNGEIRRLHGTQTELKHKNDFCQQTIERLEGSLGTSQRQGEEAQRRIELLRLEATQGAEDMKKVCNDLQGNEQELVIMTREKQTVATEKQRLQIQFNNLTQMNQTLHEKVELHTMQAEEMQCQYQRLLEETVADKEERMRSEKHLHMLELSAAKDTIRHLEGVEKRLRDATSKLETVTSEKHLLHAEIKTLKDTLKNYEDTDRQLDAANEEIEVKNKILGDKTQALVDLNKQLRKAEDEARHLLDMSRMEIEDSRSNAYRLTCGKDELVRLKNCLETNMSNLRVEKEQLMLSLGQEKREIVRRAEDLQETIAGLRKEGARAASEISDLQHALSEKKRELEYLQENLGGQTTDTRMIKSALDALSSTHTELQAQFVSLSDQRLKENQELRNTIGSLQVEIESRTKHCDALKQSLVIQRQEIDLLMAQHDTQVVQLADGHRSEAIQLIESHRAQIAHMAEQHLSQVNKLKEDHRSEVNQLTQERERGVNQVSDLIAEHQSEVSRMTDARHSEITRLQDAHQVEVDRLADDLRYEVSELAVDRLSLITEQTEARRVEVARLEQERDNVVAQVKEDHRKELARMAGDQERVKTRAIDQQQQQMLLEHAADEQIRVLVCAHSLELMTIHVAHEHEIGSMGQHATKSEQSRNEQPSELQARYSQLAADHFQAMALIKQMEVEHAQTLGNLNSEQDQTVLEMEQQHESETITANKCDAQAVVGHKKAVNELNETFAQTTELMRLRLTEEHLMEVNELLERFRVEDERHAAALALVRGELSDKSNTLKSVEDVMRALKADISELQTQLQESKQEVSERDAVVAAKNATIDNVRKELNLLSETGKSTRSSEQFVALLRQQLETHMMEVYHVELGKLEGFEMEEESDLLGCLKGFFAMRCYRGVAPQDANGNPEPSKAVTKVDEVRQRLQEYDRMIAAFEQGTSNITNNLDRSPSGRIASLRSEVGRLKLHVSNMFIATEEGEKENTSTDALVQLLDNLAGLFERLAIPLESENALIRSRRVIAMLNGTEKLMVDARASSMKDDIQSVEDVGRLFTTIDQVLGRAREVTRSKNFVRLGDLVPLFDEWEALHKELEGSISSRDNRHGVSLDIATTRRALTVGNYLRSAEILASREEAAVFVQRCKDALELPADDDMSTPDDIVGAIEQLMKILQHFEVLQPKLGSPRRQPHAADLRPTLENKVTAVLAFVEELQLMADFAQNILSDECTNADGAASNESSSSSLELVRALARTPSPAPTLDELQLDVDIAVDDALQGFDRNLCEFSDDEGDRQREAFFASPEEKSSSRSPSPFLADSLLDISLVMSDHHRLLSQTARWVAKSRQGGARGQTFSVGTEISRLVREHCALLSLSRRLFKMKDPRQELVSLLENVALLERMTARLALFRMGSARDTDSNPSGSATSLGGSEMDSIESLSCPVLASIGEMARHLQDYDYFLQQIRLDEGRTNRENNSPATINIEALVQEISERVVLVEQSKTLLGLQNPVEELPPFLVGAQEVLRQAKQLRESSTYFEKCPTPNGDEPQEVDGVDEGTRTGNGVEAVLSEMDAVVEDLRSYRGMLAWMKQRLPHPESVRSVTDLKDRVNGVLGQVEALRSDNTTLMRDKARLHSALEQMEHTRDHLVEEASKEDALLQELAALEARALLSPVDEVSTRIELVQALIKQQQRACDDAQQRRADLNSETAFLRQHDLLPTHTGSDDADQEISLSLTARLGIYNRLLECADNLRSEKREMESTLKAEKDTVEAALNAEKNALETSLSGEIQRKTEKLESVEGELAQTRQEMEKALAEERVFLESKEEFSLVNVGRSTADGGFSRIEVYQKLHDEISHLIEEKNAVASCTAQEFKFLRANELLPSNGEAVDDVSVPATSVLSSIRLEMFQRLVDSRTQLRQHEADLAQERHFLEDKSLAFDLREPQTSRLAVYETLLAGQSALIEEKMEREVAVESEKAFLASHGVPAFENPMEIYEQFVQARKQLDELATELEEELRFLAENELYYSNELDGEAATLPTSFASSFRLVVYRKFLQTEAQARETTQQLKENMEQQLSRQIADDKCVVASLTGKVERLEASLMGWQESAYASQREWDRMLLDEEDKRRRLIRHHEDGQKQIAEVHARALEEITNDRDSAVALASATHAEALEEATKEHERRLASELHKQAQQLELAAFVEAENETRKQSSDTSISHTSTALSAAQTRAQLLEKFSKRESTAISMIYKVIRLTTDILSATPSAPARTIPGNTSTSEVSTDLTQTVLACVKELKTLKEFLVQSLEQVVKDDDHVLPPFAQAPYAKWTADAVTRATADTECAIDLALCSHREFMSFAETHLLTRQEEVEKALARVYDKLKAAATNGGFTQDQEKMLALELEITREREARENVACKYRLNEEYYRRLLEERKDMEIAQAANVGCLREECTTLRLKLEKLEQQIQQQTVLPQFRPSSSNMHTSSSRAAVMSPQTPRVLKTAAVTNVPMPMRPERPRGGGSAHKERFVSDLERETGQRRTNMTARRFNEWRTREEAITENPGSQLEQDFRAMQTAMTSHHAPAMEPVVPTAMTAPATAPGSSLQNQELWYQGVRSIHYVSFFVSIFHVPRQQLFRVEVFNSDTEQQQQTVYVTWTEMLAFLQESRKAVRLGIALPADPEMAVTVPRHVRAEVVDVLFERVRVYGEGSENILLGFE
ncbi:hypothetical protein PHYPSEUDO_005435 [Phytophthora pseudosyringae]|uniref:Uncharacterized protein n=1 Tax=Phytophthora pseudosyringae TaxID=221518 RepID=A0A8T1VRB8_9STRA|nr:hypothetical protein PHYPSEUDO_005435 [Phytophthora pseudosyringae]